MSDHLRRLAARASGDPWFLGWVLTAYQRRHDLDDVTLARELGANDTAVVVALRLCRRPGTAEPVWTMDEDVNEIAKRFSIDADALRMIVNEAEMEAP